MKAKYIKLRPANQSLIKDTLSKSIHVLLTITQQPQNLEIDNLFRCKKTYKFADGETVYIPKLLPESHNLYSFIGHVLSSVDLDEPVAREIVESIFKSVNIIKKALLLSFAHDHSVSTPDLNHMGLIKKLDEINALYGQLLTADLRNQLGYTVKQGNHKTKVTVKKKK